VHKCTKHRGSRLVPLKGAVTALDESMRTDKGDRYGCICKKDCTSDSWRSRSLSGSKAFDSLSKQEYLIRSTK
jgi:hypothetical protein